MFVCVVCVQVKAVKFGHVLVIDEADKAPTNVTCILKTLVESGEMILADGRRIISGALIRTFMHAHTLTADMSQIQNDNCFYDELRTACTARQTRVEHQMQATEGSLG